MGSVIITTPEGQVLRTTPVAIGLYDAESGRSRILAGMKKCPGVLVSSNCVVYEDAFDEHGVRASVVYTAERGSFAADVVLTEPLDPAEYGFSARTTRIQVYTEYYSPPQPHRVVRPLRVEPDDQVRRRMASPDLMDETLGFGEFVYSGGRVYATDTKATAAAPVAKEFKTLGARTFLIESVEFPDIAAGLQAMATGRTNRTAFNSRGRNQAGYAAIPQAADRGTGSLSVSQRTRTELASIAPKKISGVVIDPVATIGGNLSDTMVFRSDTTYFVAQPFYCNGPVILEAAVLKFPKSNRYPATTAYVQINNSVTCKTSSYYPAVFTAGDDESCGESLADTFDPNTGIWTSSIWPAWTGSIEPNVYYANPALYVTAVSATLSNLRFRYAQEGVRINGDNASSSFPHKIAHSQFVNGLRGIVLEGTVSAAPEPPQAMLNRGAGPGVLARLFDWMGGSVALCLAQQPPPGPRFRVTVNNCLFAANPYPLNLAVPLSLTLNNCTLDNASVANSGPLVTSTSPSHLDPPTVSFVNCVLASLPTLSSGRLTLSGSYNGFYSSPQFGTVPVPANDTDGDGVVDAPFQVSGGGAHYLKANSSFRQAGNPSVGSDLAACLKGKTTQPPIRFPGAMILTGELTLFPQVPRYGSGAPDLGCYFEALDYTVPGMILKSATVTMQPGTAIGFCSEYAPAQRGWNCYGFDLKRGAKLVSHGTPEHPNTFVDAQMVQEGAQWACDALLIPDFWPGTDGAPPPVMDFRFSNFYPGQARFHCWSGCIWTPAGADWVSANSCLSWNMRDCNLYSGHIAVAEPDPWYDFQIVWGGGSVDWRNNLFDRVNVMLDPTYYADPERGGGVVNVDMALHLYNNLFCEGQMFINPIPATAGNWTFKDNLFDKVAFELYKFDEPWAATLENDYNGYWPRTTLGQGIWAPQVAHILIDPANAAAYAANDRLLTATPAYQTGPLGDYYLNPSSELYSSPPNPDKRGSRSVADAGLYHYTTLAAAQTKDGEQPGNVIIGRHYVATTGPNSTQPVDSETPTGDGLPDYVEDANGNNDPGDVAAGLETSPTLAETTTGTPDSRNPLYANVDFDSDGMIGFVEEFLGTNPLVADSPLTAPSLPGPSVTGTHEIAVNISQTVLDAVDGVMLFSIDEELHPAPGAEALKIVGGVSSIEWNTRYHPNGYHPVCYVMNCGPGLPPVYGPWRAVTTRNVVLFPQAYDGFGTCLRVLAVAGPSAEYEIEFYNEDGTPVMYNDNGTQRQFAIAGTADGWGVIDYTWDLILPDQTTFVGSGVRGDFHVSASADPTVPPPCPPGVPCIPPVEPNKRVWKYDHWTDDNTMVIGRPRACPDEDARAQGIAAAGVIDRIADYTLLDEPYSLAPQNGTGDEYEENRFIADCDWAYWPDTSDHVFRLRRGNREQFLSALATSRNFYWQGHSSGSGVGYSIIQTNYRACPGVWSSDSTRISSRDIRDRLNNHTRYYGHSYRFVFINGCFSARGDLCTAFGIPAWPNAAVQTFAGLGVPPRAFIGSTDAIDNIASSDPYKSKDDDDWEALEGCCSIIVFFNHWMAGDYLSTCLDKAKSEYDPADLLDIAAYDADKGADMRIPLDKSFRILGAINLRRQ